MWAAPFGLFDGLYLLEICRFHPPRGLIKLPAVGIMKTIHSGRKLDCLMTALHVGKNEAMAKDVNKRAVCFA